MAGPTKEFEVHPYVQFMMDKYSPYKRWIESEGVPIIAAFKASAGETGYLWYFDFDGDGDVDGHDNGQFNRRFGRT